MGLCFFQTTHFYCDDYENICSSSYLNKLILNMNNGYGFCYVVWIVIHDKPMYSKLNQIFYRLLFTQF